MSYDVSFKVRVAGTNTYIPIRYVANITWNLGRMIRAATGLEWVNEANNGRCIDVEPYIWHGICELIMYPEQYEQYEAPNGYGTVKGCLTFLKTIHEEWKNVKQEYPELREHITFWIE